MVAQIEAYVGLTPAWAIGDGFDPAVLEAMRRTPRHAFVPAEVRDEAYHDQPVPIGFGQTISQPFIVALMTDLLDLRPSDTVLEVGTGLGYQTAILAELACHVYSVELIDELAVDARQRLARRGYTNIDVRVGDGHAGWPDHAPFDKIIVTAAPDVIPPALISQLAAGGKMVIPAGPPDEQRLLLVEKGPGSDISTRELLPVRFSVLDQA